MFSQHTTLHSWENSRIGRIAIGNLFSLQMRAGSQWAHVTGMNESGDTVVNVMPMGPWLLLGFKLLRMIVWTYKVAVGPGFPAEKNSIDRHQNKRYAILACDQSLARPAYLVFWRWSLLFFLAGFLLVKSNAWPHAVRGCRQFLDGLGWMALLPLT